MTKVKENIAGYKTQKLKGKATTAKQSVMAMVKRLRDDVTLEDIMYELYVLEKIEKGMQELDEGKGIPHAEAKRRLSKWLK